MWYNNNSSTEISRKFYEKYNWIKEVTREIINEFVKKIIEGKCDPETNSRDIKIEWRYQF